MLRKILLEEYDKIDDEAVRKKQDVCYFVGLVQKNYDELVNIHTFMPNLSEEFKNRRLYELVKNAIANRGKYIMLGEKASFDPEFKVLQLLGLL